jgi:hypothetical protein
MRSATSHVAPSPIVVTWRITWTVFSLVVVPGMVCGISAVPVIVAWRSLLRLTASDQLLRLALISVALVPSYVLFALCLMIVSPIATRLLGWRTPIDQEMWIIDMEWRLLRWVRYGASLHVVRLIAGSLVRGTPLWTAHLRLSEARLGNRVYRT